MSEAVIDVSCTLSRVPGRAAEFRQRVDLTRSNPLVTEIEAENAGDLAPISIVNGAVPIQSTAP